MRLVKVWFFGAYLGITGFLFNCTPSNSTLPPLLYIENKDTCLKETLNGWVYKGKLFNGYWVEKDREGRIVYQAPVINGKEDGLAKGWYNTREKLMIRYYKNGMKEGVFKQWWPNGHYRYLFNYHTDQMDGQQFVFFPDGKKRQESNFVNGKEEGIQRVWDSKGALISNYTVKDGKIYGVIKVKSCITYGH